MRRPDAPAPMSTPQVLSGRYRLARFIARGGMAEVWEGQDQVLHRSVAVKVLQRQYEADEVFLERFRREAVAAAGLTHPGVVATYDAGTDEQTTYIVMELVRGDTLRRFLSERGPLSPVLALELASQITEALVHAHRAGIVHRDIKPANILLCSDEEGSPRVKVTDFGIAKAAAGLDQGQDLTVTGLVLGTPRYLSPEQIKGQEPDGRADLYALGVVLFEALTGRSPFNGETEMAMAMARLNEPAPRVRQLRPEVPQALDDLVAGLLVTDPAGRIPSALALREQIAHLRGARTGIHTVADPTGHARGAAPLPYTGTGHSGAVPPGAVPPGAGYSGAVSPGAAGTHSHAGQGPPRSYSGAPGPSRAAPAGTQSHGARGPASQGQGPGAGGGYGPGVANGRTGTQQAPRGTARKGAAGPEADGSRQGRKAQPAKQKSKPSPAARRRRRLPAFVVGIVASVAVVVAYLLVGNPSPGGGGSEANKPLPVQNASVWIPPMAHSPDDAANAKNTIDGNPQTSWSTVHYYTSNFGGLGGEGLQLKLNGSHTLHKLAVTSPTAGWEASVYVSDHPIPPRAPVTDWGPVVQQKTGITGSTTFNLSGHRGDYVLLFMTNTGPGQQITISELVVS